MHEGNAIIHVAPLSKSIEGCGMVVPYDSSGISNTTRAPPWQRPRLDPGDCVSDHITFSDAERPGGIRRWSYVPIYLEPMFVLGPGVISTHLRLATERVSRDRLAPGAAVKRSPFQAAPRRGSSHRVRTPRPQTRPRPCPSRMAGVPSCPLTSRS